MQPTHRFIAISPVFWIIFISAVVKFALQIVIAPGYGFFGDELYTMALSRHLDIGYVDLPPLVPALMAASRAFLGESMLAFHVVPALAGAIKLVFICLITREMGGGRFAVFISGLLVISVPVWLSLDSIFCYDSIDQMILAGFLFTLVLFLKSGNVKYWPILGLIAGIACMTKMTMLFLGPGFLVALFLSRYRRHLLTPWPYVGALICLVVVSPYILWQISNGWPTLDYWTGYGTIRVFKASFFQFLTNIWIYTNPFLLPVWIIGLYRIFHRINGVNYSFFGFLFFFTLLLLFFLHSTARLFVELFAPIVASTAIWFEEGINRLRWKAIAGSALTVYVLAATCAVIPSSLPILPVKYLPEITRSSQPWFGAMREFIGGNSNSPFILTGRRGWDDLTRVTADAFNSLSEEEREIAGIYADSYMRAAAIDFYGPQFELPHAVSESLTYYLWGPGYSWDVMIVVTGRSNNLSMFFDSCELNTVIEGGYDSSLFGKPHIYVCRKPKITPDEIWKSMKNFR